MGFFKLTIRDVPLDNQTVLLRADYNVPLDSHGKIDNDLRIKASVPTIQYLLSRGCKVVVMSHLGRPEGKDKTLSLEPIAKRLGELLGQPVGFAHDCKGDVALQAVKKTPAKGVILLENLRYYAEEEADDLDFAKAIAKASGARYFVQDGFGVVHRAHASTHAITQCLPSVAGLLLEKEYTMITEAMEKPKRPLVAVIGGAKVSDKIAIIERFVDVADKIVIGGAMANTFLEYKGDDMGESKVEPEQHDELNRIYDKARAKVGDNTDEFILLPTDLAVAKSIGETSKRHNVLVNDLADDDDALDIGDASIEAVVNLAKTAGTVVWNGTLGYAELSEFAHGSARLALTLATSPGITSIIGGGDTADFVLKWEGGEGKSFSHVSTGGGASLELMAGDKLPGIESLLNAYK